ncbi:hypothetical protein A0U40_13505 [[Bacillus] sp. KCTC 13219]|nr:hypothetical protein A0U40_13505 [[Bacillus] sp. KCTC 13219]
MGQSSEKCSQKENKWAFDFGQVNLKSLILTNDKEWYEKMKAQGNIGVLFEPSLLIDEVNPFYLVGIQNVTSTQTESKVKEAALLLLQELRLEIEKGDTQEINYSNILEKISLVIEPVRYLASRDKLTKRIKK